MFCVLLLAFKRPVQLKYTSTHVFIYCVAWDIVFSNISIPCPEYVFSLPIESSFRIGTLVHTGKRHLIRTNVTLTDHLSIIHHLYPRANKDSLSFLGDIRRIRDDLKTTKDSLDNVPFLHFKPSVWSIACSASAAILLLYIIQKIRSCFLGRTRESGASHIPSDDIELESYDGSRPQARRLQHLLGDSQDG